MSELFRHDITLFRKYTAGDDRRIPAGDVVCNVYREGATVSSNTSIADGAGGSIPVYDPGAIVSGDTIQVGTDSSVTRTVSSITASSVVVSAGTGVFAPDQYERLVVTTNRPTTWLSDRDDSGYPTTAVASQATTDATSGTATFYTGEQTLDIITTDDVTLTLFADQTGSGGKRDYRPQIYGARGDAATDATAAFADLFEYLKVRNGVAEIPPGTYVLSSALALSAITGLKIRGAGPNLTIILLNHTGEGFTFTGATDCEVSGMTIFRVSGTTAAISTDATSARTVISNVYFGGSGTGVLDKGTETTLRDLSFTSAAPTRLIHLYGAVRPHLHSIRARWTGAVAQAAIDIDTDCVSPRLNLVDLSPTTIASDNGIALRIAQNSAGTSAPLDVVVVGSRFCGGTGAGGKQAVQLSGCLGAEFHACNVVESLIGYDINSVTGLKIVGGMSHQIRQDGIDIDGGSYIDIIGHTSSNVNVGAGSSDHVNIAAGVDDVSIIGLRVGRFISGTGTAQARYGVAVESGASDRIQVMGLSGVITDLSTGWILNSSTSNDVDVSHNLQAGAGSTTYLHTPRTMTLTATTTEPSVKNFGAIYLQQSGATVITNFADARDGQQLMLFAGNGNTTINDGGNFALDGGVAWVSGANDTLVLVYSTTLGIWCEISRANN